METIFPEFISISKGLLFLVFTSNYCPFSKSYEDRLVATERRFTSQSYPMILINPMILKLIRRQSGEYFGPGKGERLGFPYTQR
ncbi:MAG: hypothetical protein IPO04_08325 [Cytophagaceae bacterium]|nr:hypothetical protein [Cytophagaceae bacterium]